PRPRWMRGETYSQVESSFRPGPVKECVLGKFSIWRFKITVGSQVACYGSKINTLWTREVVLIVVVTNVVTIYLISPKPSFSGGLKVVCIVNSIPFDST